jgi:U3 small nucleolar RNA-associated protein 22
LLLAQANWDKEGLMLNSNKNEDEHCLPLNDYHKYYDVVFIDSTGYLNLCSNMNKNTFKRVKHEATLAIKFLNDQFIDSFDALFIKKLKFFEAFDSILR